MKRYNKEYKLSNFGPIQMKLGTINNEDPKVVYVSGKCWLTPKAEIDYKAAFDEISRKVEKKTKSVINDDESFSNKFIFNFDINPESFIFGKKKYFAFDIFFRQNEDRKRKLKQLIPEFNANMNEICNTIVNELEEYGFSIEMAA